MPLLVDEALFDLDIRIPERNTSLGIDGSAAYKQHVLKFVGRYSNGVGVNKVDVAWSTRQVISGATDFDLRGGLTSLLNSAVVNFPIVMGLFVVNYSVTTGEYVTVGGGSNPWITWLTASGDGVRVGPEGFKALWSPRDGYATVAGTGDILRVTPAAGTPTVGLLVVGRQS